MICPDCDGNKTAFVHINRGDNPHTWEDVPCFRCHGDGVVPDIQAEWMRVGEAHRARRLAANESLLECSRRLGCRPAALSAMERGTADPKLVADDLVEVPQ